MYAGTEMEPYMTAIREQVCSRCVERPTGGPPCLPLGKRCGIEINLPQLVESVSKVSADVMEPYIDGFHDGVCEDCVNRNQPQCPCPLDFLLPLAVNAIESVNAERRGK